MDQFDGENIYQSIQNKGYYIEGEELKKQAHGVENLEMLKQGVFSAEKHPGKAQTIKEKVLASIYPAWLLVFITVLAISSIIVAIVAFEESKEAQADADDVTAVFTEMEVLVAQLAQELSVNQEQVESISMDISMEDLEVGPIGTQDRTLSQLR